MTGGLKKGDDAAKQDLVWVGLPVYVAVELSDLAGRPNHIRISPPVRNSIVKEGYRPNVVHSDGQSMWTRTTRKLKSAGEYKPRYTSYYSTLF